MKFHLFSAAALCLLGVLSFGACNESSPHNDEHADSATVETPGDTNVNDSDDTVSETDTETESDTHKSPMPTEDAALLQTISEEYTASRTLTATSLAQQYPAQSNTALDYAPLDAVNLPLIQSSELALNDAELALLNDNGFAISKRLIEESFFAGYAEIYKADLPVYISADAILDSIHRSFDSILKHLESQVLYSTLDALLYNLRTELQNDASLSSTTKADLDLYLVIAHSLLREELLETTNADPTQVADLYNKAQAAGGIEEVTLFDDRRNIDFSQFTPRGHYTESAELTAYFKSMMWLGRIDFRLVETNSLGIQKLNRSQLTAALAVGRLMKSHQTLWSQINQVIQLFVGESDNMTPLQVDDLMNTLEITDLAALADLSDVQLMHTILENGFGAQKINSHLMTNGLTAGTLPLNASFLLFGQRFVIDSYVFSNLVYDRVQEGTVYRMMPSPLDVAFAVMNNNLAGVLLQPELAAYPYAPDVHMMRTIVGTYDDDFWQANLYNNWLHSLSTLSESAKEGMPSYTQTVQWEKRMLNTQLASWAELRHDTILYAKQSYTDGASCQFPEAYVEPYPAFFEKLVSYADTGMKVMSLLSNAQPHALVTQALDYFTELAFACEILGEMAQQQLDGIPHTAAQLAFINDAIRIDSIPAGCTSEPVPAGWYKRLFFDAENALERDPTIADVHTQPTDEGGTQVGKVLHVATGLPRTMVVTVNQCDGPRAYMGMVFSYYEKITENFQRMNDEEWSAEVAGEYNLPQYPWTEPSDSPPPEDIPWMTNLIAQ